MGRSWNVFVDTQAFHQHHFRFDQSVLKRLLELCSSKKMRLVLTETVLGEVRAHIKDQIVDAFKSLGQFHKFTGPLEGSLPEKYQGLLVRPSESELVELAVKSWERYLADTGAVVAPASAVSAADLLELYFASSPPFGEGRKKNEFPDAISMLSLAAWTQANQTSIYVISRDSDIERWSAQSQNVVHIKSLPEFIDIYNRAEQALTELTDSTHKLFKKKEAWFLNFIEKQFLQSGFQYSDNWEAVVENVEVQNIEVVEVNVIEVEDDRALVSVIVMIEFSASISGPDYERGIWDDEERSYAYLPIFNFEHTFREGYEVLVAFTFTPDAEEVEEILSVTVEDGSDITLNSQDGYPYK